MINIPMTLLAQIDDVAVFQTAAFFNDDIGSDTITKALRVNQQCNQSNKADYGELNLGLHVNDDATKVLNNRMRLLTAINEPTSYLSSEQKQCLLIKRLHWVNQIHGKQIHDIDDTQLGMEPVAADAMISQRQGLGLAIMTADCVPIVLYQPATGQIAAIHAGWQGLACGIIPETVKRFAKSAPIKAWIGVCISQENYEVGSQVRDKLLAGCRDNQSLSAQVIGSTSDFDRLYVTKSKTPPKNIVTDALEDAANSQSSLDTAAEAANGTTIYTDKIKLNLPKLAADQLSTAGVTLDKALPISCSYADGHYYSYRRQTHLQQPATGRMALVIARGVTIE